MQIMVKIIYVSIGAGRVSRIAGRTLVSLIAVATTSLVLSRRARYTTRRRLRIRSAVVARITGARAIVASVARLTARGARIGFTLSAACVSA